MFLNITRVDPTLPMPEYKTSGSVAFDLYTRVDITIAPKSIALVPTNIIAQCPAGYGLFMAARSSTPVKKGLMLAQGIGVIDQDFSGPEDEIRAPLYNFTDTPISLVRGDRVAQAWLSSVEKCIIKESALETAVSRGGIGSTGT